MNFGGKWRMNFFLKYISGLAFAVICFFAAVFIYGLFLIPRGSCVGALGMAFAVGILAGIPTGAVLGIFLVVATIWQQLQAIKGFLTGFAVSVFLVFLMFFLGRLESYLLITPKDKPIIGNIILFIFFSTFILGVLAALLGYTHAGSAKRKTAQKPSEQ
jgi:hypothetical protein